MENPDMAHQNVCKYFKFGFCKYTDTCRQSHVSEICENFTCEIGKCHLRHPKTCKYYSEFSRCKFSEYCLFKHVRNVNKFDILMKENTENKTKIVKLEENLNEK